MILCDEHRRGVVLVVCAAVLWSSSGLLVRLVEASEITIIFWRSLFASLVLLSFYLSRSNQSLWSFFRQLGVPGLMVSLFFAADTMLFIYALTRTTIANAMLIFSTTPFMAALLAWLFLRERVAPLTWFAMTACAAGIGIMVSASIGQASIVGDAIALCVALLFAVPVVIIRRYPHIQMVPAVLLSAVMTALFCLPFATLWGHNPKDYVLMGLFGAFEYGLALVLFTVGARLIPAAQSTVIGLLETVLAPLWVWLVVNEYPGGHTMVGGAVVLASLATYCILDLRMNRTSPA